MNKIGVYSAEVSDQNFVNEDAEQKGERTTNGTEQLTNSWRRSDQVSNTVLFIYKRY